MLLELIAVGRAGRGSRYQLGYAIAPPTRALGAGPFPAVLSQSTYIGTKELPVRGGADVQHRLRQITQELLQYPLVDQIQLSERMNFPESVEQIVGRRDCVLLHADLSLRPGLNGGGHQGGGIRKQQRHGALSQKRSELIRKGLMEFVNSFLDLCVLVTHRVILPSPGLIGIEVELCFHDNTLPRPCSMLALGLTGGPA